MRLILVLAFLGALTACATRTAEHRSAADWPGRSAQDDSPGSRIALRALDFVGVPYRYGGRSPDTGFDCSGLVHYVVASVTGMALPRRAQDMSRVGAPVRRRELAPGDLVFFDTLREPYSHVGVYLGESRFVHAPSNGGRVEVVSMNERYWLLRYSGARRVSN